MQRGIKLISALLIIVSFTFISYSSTAQNSIRQIVAYDDFDGGSGDFGIAGGSGWTNKVWNFNGQIYYSGDLSHQGPGKASILVLGPDASIDRCTMLKGFTGANLTFWYAAFGMDEGDQFEVQIDDDGINKGDGFKTAAVFSEGAPEGDPWRFANIDISSFDMSDELVIKIVNTVDNGNWIANFVDEVKIEADVYDPYVKVLEAENAELTGCETFVDPNAHGGKAVMNFGTNVGDNIVFTVPYHGTRLVLRYTGAFSGTVSIYKKRGDNWINKGDIKIFESSKANKDPGGQWTRYYEQSVHNILILPGDKIKLQIDEEDVEAVNIDAIQVLPFPISVKSKFTPRFGKVLNVIGQTKEHMPAHQQNLQTCPGGSSTFTNIADLAQGENKLDGLYEESQSSGVYDFGTKHGIYWIEEWTRSAQVIGLYLVDEVSDNDVEPLKKIASGQWDHYLDELGEYILLADRPVYLKIGYEFDGKWKVTWNAYDPDDYIAAFRYIVNYYRAKSIPVASVWQYAAYDWGQSAGNNPFTRWYPGTEYVDWFAVSYFHAAMNTHEPFLRFARQERKPVMIAEATPQGYDLTNLTWAHPYTTTTPDPESVTSQQIWDQWYSQYFEYIKVNFDIVKCATIIADNWSDFSAWNPENGNGYWGDARIYNNPDISTWWQNEMSKYYYQHGTSNFKRTFKGWNK